VLAQEAAGLLLYTPMQIREVAETLDFADEFVFSKFFKKQRGMPPSVFRRSTV
jgi:AraC-like DNA-binding protein